MQTMGILSAALPDSASTGIISATVSTSAISLRIDCFMLLPPEITIRRRGARPVTA